MNTAHVLAERLAELNAEELADLLRTRRVHGSAAQGRGGPQSLEQLAGRLLEDRSVAGAVSSLTAPGLQLLSATVWLAARRHGALQQQPYWTTFDPAGRAVSVDELTGFLSGDSAEKRRAVDRTLAELRTLMLVLPSAADRVVLPVFVHRHLADAVGITRPVEQLMAEAFNAPEVHRIAAALDQPVNRNRESAQAAVAAALGDPELLLGLLASAPAQAVDLLDRLVSGPPLLRTDCFVPLGGYHYGNGTKYQLRSGGSSDPGSAWLAEHGLLVPIGPELAELPYEVLSALADSKLTARFDPEPPALDTGLHPVPDALRQAQAAASSASRKVELLLAACAAAPPAVRKVGGLAVRDTRRLAKAVDCGDDQARLWIDLAYNADLLAEHRDQPDSPPPRGRGRRPALPSTPLRLLPTVRYDTWLARSPAERLVPLVATWAVVPELLSWWPDFREDTPVALVAPQDPEAVALRRLVLTVLGTLPEGSGLGPVAGFGPAVLARLLERLGWQSPALVPGDEQSLERVVSTLLEAELLGVVAQGRLTPLGRGVLALLGTDAADWFPYVPLEPAAGRSAAAPYREALLALRAAADALLPPPQESVRFQADLTAIAAGAPSAALAELLGSAADRESEGHAVVWRFGAASVRRALDGGQTSAELLERLREVSEGELPQPLEYLVRDTGRTHGQVRVVRSACCVRSDDESLVLELAGSRMLAKVGLRRIAPTVLISTHSPSATLQALRAAGYAPVLEAETGVTVVERAAEARAESRMPDLARMRSARGRTAASPEELARELLTRRA